MINSFLYDRKIKKRQFFIDSQRTSFECFLDEIEINEPYSENEDLVIKIIDLLRQKYNLLNL